MKFIHAAVAAIFLSSQAAAVARPAGDAAKLVYLPPFPTEQQEVVPYTEFDTSVYLNGWYEMFALQLALGIYEDEEEDEKNRLEEYRQHKLKVQNMHTRAWEMLGLVGFIFAVCFLLLYYKQGDKENPT